MSMHNSNIELLRGAITDNEILSFFKSYRKIENIYLGGGYLRDLLMHRGCGKDIDVFLDATPAQIETLVEDLKALGKVEYGQYGSPRLFCNNTSIDIVPFYNFIVGKKKIETIDELLRNFDITANAIALNLKTGEILDPVGGIQDIEHKILRAVRLDFPEKNVAGNISLSAVSVFWFRLLHYQNKLGFSFERKTKEWILANKFRWKDVMLMKQFFFEPKLSEEMYNTIVR